MLEVAEKLFPFGVGRGAVFLGGPGGPAAGDERPVGASFGRMPESLDILISGVRPLVFSGERKGRGLVP